MAHYVRRDADVRVSGTLRNSLFRGQFILGPSYVDKFPGWSRYSLARDLRLTVHPDLPVTRAVSGSRTLTLIGYILDPAEPQARDRDILAPLLPMCASVYQLIERCAAFGGRWAMIAQCDDGHYLFNDALGLRQVFHTRAGDGNDVWACSQPGIAIDALALPFDEHALQFLDSHAFRLHAEYRWPAIGTVLRGLYHLLPNHLMDLRSGAVTRYWPAPVLRTVSVDEAVERVGATLSGMMRAAAARFDLALAITAGIDSRVVLAAARPIRNQLRYMTVRQAKMADDNPDLVVPHRLLARLGLTHEVIRARASMTPEFSWLFKRNVFLAHDHYGADAEAILAWHGGRCVVVTGSGAEVGRCSFRKELAFPNRRRITALDLARLQRMRHPYALRLFDEWLAGLGDRGRVHVLDLFEWEQGHGNWLAMTQLEFDVAWNDIFTPYNCRELLTVLLSVEERYRGAPKYSLFRSLARKLWPEVLSEPINPTQSPDLARRCAGLLRRSWRLVPGVA